MNNENPKQIGSMMGGNEGWHGNTHKNRPHRTGYNKYRKGRQYDWEYCKTTSGDKQSRRSDDDRYGYNEDASEEGPYERMHNNTSFIFNRLGPRD